LPGVAGFTLVGRGSLAELLFDVRCRSGWGEMGFALVVLDHGYGPCFKVDRSALCGLKEGIVFLLGLAHFTSIPVKATYV